MTDTERSERVDDGVDDGRRQPDRARFAQSLGAQRVIGRRRVVMEDLGDRHVVSARQRVVHQGTGQQMPVAVEDDRLHQDLAPRLRQRALELAVGQEWIDDCPRIVHPHDALGHDDAGLALEPHGDDERARAPHLARRLEEARGLEPRLDAGRQRAHAIRRVSHRPPGERASRRADDVETAWRGDDVVGRRFEQ